MLFCTGVVIEGPSNVTYFPGITPLPIEMTCNISTGTEKLWTINNSYWLYNELYEGRLPGHSLSETDNILINSPVNNTKYTCVSYAYEEEYEYFSYPGYVIVAGEL